MIQPYYNNSMYSQPYMPKQIDSNNNIIWADGEVGAKAYPLYGFNNGVILMDREEDNIIYIKTTDAQGRPTTQRYKITLDVKEEPKTESLSNYVRKDELQDLIKSILQPAQEEGKNESTVSTTQPTIIKRTLT